MVEVKQLFNGGYSGSDRAKIQKHIEEVQALGAAAPTTIPVVYPLPNNLVTTAETLQVQHSQTSGEIEYVLIWWGGNLYVTVGSDHTDRRLESYSIQVAKQLYPNIVAPAVWRYEDVQDHWNKIELECWATTGRLRQLYQKGTLADLMTPQEWETIFAQLNVEQDGTIFFAGTINTLMGEIVYADSYEIRMIDPVKGRSISHSYTLEMLPRAIE